MDDGTALFTYTIYEQPRDHPHAWVVRRWVVDERGTVDDGVWCLAVNLDAARESIPPGLVCLTRDPADDPCIVETWL